MPTPWQGSSHPISCTPCRRSGVLHGLGCVVGRAEGRSVEVGWDAGMMLANAQELVDVVPQASLINTCGCDVIVVLPVLCVCMRVFVC